MLWYHCFTIPIADLCLPHILRTIYLRLIAKLLLRFCSLPGYKSVHIEVYGFRGKKKFRLFLTLCLVGFFIARLVGHFCLFFEFSALWNVVRYRFNYKLTGELMNCEVFLCVVYVLVLPSLFVYFGFKMNPTEMLKMSKSQNVSKCCRGRRRKSRSLLWMHKQVFVKQNINVGRRLPPTLSLICICAPGTIIAIRFTLFVRFCICANKRRILGSSHPSFRMVCPHVHSPQPLNLFERNLVPFCLGNLLFHNGFVSKYLSSSSY